jgi:hypothetical protein
VNARLQELGNTAGQTDTAAEAVVRVLKDLSTEAGDLNKKVSGFLRDVREG